MELPGMGGLVIMPNGSPKAASPTQEDTKQQPQDNQQLQETLSKEDAPGRQDDPTGKSTRPALSHRRSGRSEIFSISGELALTRIGLASIYPALFYQRVTCPRLCKPIGGGPPRGRDSLYQLAVSSNREFSPGKVEQVIGLAGEAQQSDWIRQVGTPASRTRRIALKAICKLSIGCITVAVMAPSAAWAASHAMTTALVTVNAAIGQSDSADEATRRRESDKWLRQARQNLEQGNFEAAEYCVQRAEKLNAKYDSVLSRFADTPQKVRQALEAAQMKQGGNVTRPSERFTPGGASAAAERTGSPARSPQSPEQTLNMLTNDAKAKASEYLARGRAALQQGDQLAAIASYQQAAALGATFSNQEYAPAQLAAELEKAGVDPARLKAAAPTAPFATQPSGFSMTDLDRLPPITNAPLRANQVFQGAVVTNPAQLGAAGNARPASPEKSAAMRLLAQAQAALQRGDLTSARQLAQQAQAIRVPESEFAPGETRPWELVLQINSAINRRGGSGVQPPANYEPVAPAVASGGGLSSPYPVQPGVYAPEHDMTQNRYAQAELPNPSAQLPVGESPGHQLYREGLRALEAQDRDTALRHFRQAWGHQQELDPLTRQQLKDKLSLLSAGPAIGPLVEPSPLEEVHTQEDLLRQKLFREITTETKLAAEMIPVDPRGARERVQSLRDRVAAAEIDPAAQKQLLTIVDRELSNLDAYLKEHQSEIELNERNRAVVESIDRDRAVKIEVQNKVAELVDQFNKLLNEERFAEAEVVAKQIREIDPDSPITELVTTRSILVRRVAEQRWLSEFKEDAIYNQLTDVARSSYAPVGDNPIDFGNIDDWNKLTLSRRQRLEMQERRLTPVEMEIQQSLKKQVDVNFNNRPLKEVLDTLGSIAGINIYADPQGLAAEGITSDTPVSITLSQPVMLESALNLILQQLRLSYVIQNEVLKITSEQVRDTNTFARVYNVADLVIPIPNFIPGYNVGLPSAIREAHNALGYGGMVQPVSMASMPLTVASAELQGGATVNSSILAQTNAYGLAPNSASRSRPSQALGYGPGSMGGAALADFDTLIELITATIAPDSWEAVGGPGAIESFPTNLSLVISQTQEVHEQIADLLEQLRRLQDLQVAIEVRFITLQDNFFERIGVDFDFDVDDNVDTLPPDDEGPSIAIGLEPDGTPTADFDFQFTQGSFGETVPAFGGFNAASAANFGFAILSDIEAFFLIQAAQGDTRSNVLQAPKVTLFNGQAASVSDVSQRPFVTSLIPVVGDFAAAQQPVIVVLSEGTSLGVQAVVSSDRRFVRLTLVPFFSQIGDVEEFTFQGSTTTNTGTNVLDPDGEPTGDINNEVTITEGTTVQLPTFSFTTVSTTVSVPDGGTVLLGGIKRLREQRNEEGVPMLNKLPYINRLFKNVGIGRETQSLMLMVTPRIIIQEEEEEKLGIEITP